MAYFVYSPESFPGDYKNGRMHEYAQVLGHQVILEGNAWTKLNPRYSTRRFTSYLDETGEELTFLADEIGKALGEKYGYRGVVVTEHQPGSPESLALVALAQEANKKFREAVCLEFEKGRYHAQMTGFGRLAPTLYEIECYKSLGRDIPAAGFGHENKPVSINMPPELTTLIEKLTELTLAAKASPSPATASSGPPEAFKPAPGTPVIGSK